MTGINFRSGSGGASAPAQAAANATQNAPGTQQTPPTGGTAAGGALTGLGRRGAGGMAPRNALLPQRPGHALAPVQAATTPMTPAAQVELQAVQTAEQALPTLADTQAAASQAARLARETVQKLGDERNRASQALTTALAARTAAVTAATTARNGAQTALANAQTQHANAQQDHQTAVGARAALVTAVAQARAAQQAAPAPGPGGAAAAAQPQALRLAREQAEDNLRLHDQLIEQRRGEVDTARDAERSAQGRLDDRQAELDRANQAVTRLHTVSAGVAPAFTSHLPALQAHVQASNAAEQTAIDALREHGTLADLSLSVAHRTRVEQDSSHQDGVVAGLQAQHQVESALLAPGSALQLGLAQATAEVGQRQTAVNAAVAAVAQRRTALQLEQQGLATANAATSPSQALRAPWNEQARQAWQGTRRAVQQAEQRVQLAQRQLSLAEDQEADARRHLAQAQQRQTDANTAITQQQQQVDDLATRLAAEQPLQQTLRNEVALLQGWQQADAQPRDAQQATAAQARTQAQQSRDTADNTTRGPAQAAQQHIRAALDAVWAELAPAAPAVAQAPQKPLLERGMDGVRGTLQGLGNRTTPTKVEAILGPLSYSTGGKGPTTFNGGEAPGRSASSSALGRRGQDRIDHKTEVAGTTAAAQLAGKARTPLFGQAPPARTPEALRSAAAFTGEVARLFEPQAATPTAGTPSLVGLAPKVLANRLLDHPNPDPVNRPDGHPLRHEEALLIASALCAVTPDPAVAANVYNQLWNDVPPLAGAVSSRNPPAASPLASMATDPPGMQVSADPQIVRLAQAARRVLAGSPAGMEALQHLQGLALPPQGSSDGTRAVRARAENALENYKLSLRAETALLGMLPVGGNQTTQDVVAAIHAAPAGRGLEDANRLGTGADGPGGPEDRATLASQALLYATANAQRAPGMPELHPEFKPAYVALRNGFTESGQGSDFNAMARRLHKFIKYIDQATGEHDSFDKVLGRTMRMAKRVLGKGTSPLVTLLEAGPMGSDLGKVAVEYKKQLGVALAGSATLLENHLRAGMAGLSPADRTRGLVRLAALQLWNEKATNAADPYEKITLSPAEVQQRAQQLAGPLNAPNPALDQNVANQEIQAHLSAPLQPKLLDTWLGKGNPPGPLRPATDDQLTRLQASFSMLQGKGRFVSDLADLQKQFDQGDAAQRREVLRQVLIAVVAGGDVADYSDGRQNAISGRVGFSPAGFSINGLTAGVTPVVEGSYDRTKSTVLRAGVASNTGVLYLGTETRHAGSVGGGVRAGLEVGLGGFSAGAVGRLGGSHSSSTGLMIRTNKQGTEHLALGAAETARMKSDNWKRMSELVVNSIFDLAADGPTKPANGHDMWAAMVDKVGNYQDISFGYNRGSATSANWSLMADGIAGISLGPDDATTLLGGHVGVGVKHTFLNRSQARDSAGGLQALQGTSGSRATGAANADVGAALPLIHTPDGGAVLLLARSKIGVESELIFSASNGLVRLTTQDGRINPDVSFKHREYNLEGDFFKLVNAQRGEWRQRVGERGPDGKLHGGDAALDAFMKEAANLPPGKGRVFIERKNLRPEAAEAINACLARLDVLQRGVQEQAARGTQPTQAMQQEVQALKERIAEEVNREANWQPFRLFVNEVNQMAQESSLGWAGRFAPKERDDPLSQPDSAAEAVRYGGGKLTVGGVIRTAHGGRDLLTLDAQPERT